jgi:hypothetical protein
MGGVSAGRPDAPAGRRQRAQRTRWATRLVVAALAVMGLLAATAVGAATLLQNGSFAEGSGGAPTGWRADGWRRELSRFAWDELPDGTHAVTITNVEPNDAHWCQTVAVQPDATYRVSARVRTHDVGTGTAGALVAIEPRLGDTADIKGTMTDWQDLALDFGVGDRTSVDVCVRLGSYANLNTGSAVFTDVRLVELSAPPAHSWLRWPTWMRSSRPLWFTVGLPLVGGVILAAGLGIFRSAGR